jgi:GxxExxY protein
MTSFEPVPESVEETARVVIDSALKVHKQPGPGLLESVYAACLAYELEKRGLNVRRQLGLPVIYEAVRIDAGLRLDLLIEDSVIVELKSVEYMIPLYDAQLLTYLKLTGKRLGF